MKAVIQRVKKASVKINNEIVGEIGPGLLVLLAVHQDDTEDKIYKMADKIINLRIFSDDNNKMNLAVKDIGGLPACSPARVRLRGQADRRRQALAGEILVVSQFTLYGNSKKGNRPSFIESAKPDKAIPFYEKFVQYIRDQGIKVATGEFGAMMDVSLVNNGPVTIILNI